MRCLLLAASEFSSRVYGAQLWIGGLGRKSAVSLIFTNLSGKCIPAFFKRFRVPFVPTSLQEVPPLIMHLTCLTAGFLGL